MRILLLHVSVALLFVSNAFTQGPLSSFELGSKSVVIPAPEGFTEISARFPHVASRLAATEDPGNEILAIYLPDSLVYKFAADEDRDLEFYTKASIAKPAKTLEFTPEMFAAMTAKMEKSFDSYLKIEGPLLKQIKGNAEKGMSEFWGGETSVALNQPKSLGFFDKGENVFSAMLFINVSVGRKKYPLLVTTSSLNLNNRLVFLYAYRMSSANEDVEMLRAFTKNWTAAVIAANK
jgi:hypothetical protein